MTASWMTVACNVHVIYCNVFTMLLSLKFIFATIKRITRQFNSNKIKVARNWKPIKTTRQTEKLRIVTSPQQALEYCPGCDNSVHLAQ